MRNKNMMWTILVIVGLLLMGATAASAQSDQGKLVVINYVGSELVFTLDGTAYNVPGTDVMPEGGQMEFALAPGLHEYSGAVPGGPGANGQVDLLPGQEYIVGARIEQTAVAVSPDGVVLQEPKDVLVLFEASELPGVTEAPPPVAPLQPIPDGMGALVLDNYIGEELTVDIKGTIYQVPANGRLQVDLDPGEIAYTASVSTSSLNGLAEVMAGEYTGLGFSRDYVEPVDYEVGEPEPAPAPLELYVNPVDLSGAVVADPQAAEQSAMEEETTSETDDTGAALGVSGVTVINHTGHALTFTLMNKQYVIGEGVMETVIELNQGEYGYTASVPGVDYNGLVTIDADQMVRLSVSLSPDGSSVKVYFE